MSTTDSTTMTTGADLRPSMPRLMLAAFHAGMAAGDDPDRTRLSNPHTGDQPGDLTLATKWLDGFNRSRGMPAGALES